MRDNNNKHITSNNYLVFSNFTNWILSKIIHNKIYNIGNTEYKDIHIEELSCLIKQLISLELFEIISLSFVNIEKRSFFLEEFELHQAVIENNSRKINRICKDKR
jgi:hypothetical protein